MQDTQKAKAAVPIERKVALTKFEAAEYSNIGINKIEAMLREPGCPFCPPCGAEQETCEAKGVRGVHQRKFYNLNLTSFLPDRGLCDTMGVQRKDDGKFIAGFVDKAGKRHQRRFDTMVEADRWPYEILKEVYATKDTRKQSPELDTILEYADKRKDQKQKKSFNYERPCFHQLPHWYAEQEQLRPDVKICVSEIRQSQGWC